MKPRGEFPEVCSEKRILCLMCPPYPGVPAKHFNKELFLGPEGLSAPQDVFKRKEKVGMGLYGCIVGDSTAWCSGF